ncbi:uncharacterized protein LOC132311918 isoform X2 [Cornus florida]|uniref:uncharacterized protein LOC132311918 isoform X2 n=1 Tax=Cornus florida TaxID=4283 RepID=UPI00289B5249|nr:uncharacterized protein LOC132311918 isoform X2 [Cornus florida]
MAARQMQRRVLSLIAGSSRLPQRSLQPSLQFSPFANSSFCRAPSYRRIQTAVEPSQQAIEGCEACSSKLDSNSAKVLSDPSSNPSSAVKYNAISNLKMSPRHDLAMVFTCKVCDTRSVKTLCRESYEKGVVVARCAGCNNLHLIADHLGWFGEPGSVEELLAARGEEVKKCSMDTLNLTLEDLAGRKEETSED